MINVLFETHLAPHIHIGTLAMAYFFKTCLALTMAYIVIKMCLAFHVPFGTLAMVYILIRMHLTFHVLFETLVMAYISLKCA
jgi:hypothetical protein